MEAAFIEIDEPELAIGRHDEVAEVGIAQADMQFDETLPQLVEMPPKPQVESGRRLCFRGEIGTQRAAFDVGVHQERIAA